MKVSLNWVKEFTTIDLTVDELVKKIGAQLGAVEEVTDLGKKYQGIIIAKVVSCEKHPNADKLSLCKIDDGGTAKKVERDKEGFVQVVCGAPNVREGLLVAWLPPGSTVPKSFDKEPFVLEARELRGTVSNGMLASANELDLSDDHSGIAELSFGEPGEDFAKTFGLDDFIIDIENKMFTHRPDCFGIIGVAREIAGITGQKFVRPDLYVEKPVPKAESELPLTVKNSIPELVPRFMAQVSEGLEPVTSPVWMQAYLSRVGMRSINYVVDVTNYVMYLTGQPLHAYDYDKLCKVAGTKTAQLETRLSRKGDTLNLLNGKTIKFDDNETILITTNDVPVGVGGVMGGADTEVDETTKNIVLECATFDMYTIRKTSMRHGLFTDAVTRFNKGQSPLQNPSILYKAGDWIRQYSGKLGVTVDEHAKLSKPQTIKVSAKFINDRLGLDLDGGKMKTLLTNVEFDVERPDNKDELRVTPPFWRTDIEIPEDIVEEVGRLYGYDHLPLELPSRQVSPTPKNDLLNLKQSIRELLAKAGANEVLTYSFVHGNLLDKVGQDRKQAFELSNALSPDLQYYRLSLAPSLLDRVHMNIKAGYDEFAIFELGKGHIKGQDDPIDPGVPKEFNTLALVVAASDKLKKGAAYYTARTHLDYLANSLGITLRYEALSEAPTYPAAAPFDYKRSARIYVGEKLIGVVGEYKASVRTALKLPVATAGFEIATAAEALTSTTSKYTPLSRYPSVEQDISLKVPVNTSHAEVYASLAEVLLGNKEQISDLKPLDIFQRKGDTKHKQMTFRFTVASYQKTLKAEEVNAMLDAAAKVAKEKLHAERI